MSNIKREIVETIRKVVEVLGKYSSVYFLVFENNKFKPVYTQNEKEQELIKSVQDALLRLPGIIRQKFLPDNA